MTVTMLQRVKEALRSIKTRNIAQFEPALEEAFQLLRMVCQLNR